MRFGGQAQPAPPEAAGDGARWGADGVGGKGRDAVGSHVPEPDERQKGGSEGIREASWWGAALRQDKGRERSPRDPGGAPAAMSWPSRDVTTNGPARRACLPQSEDLRCARRASSPAGVRGV